MSNYFNLLNIEYMIDIQLDRNTIILIVLVILLVCSLINTSSEEGMINISPLNEPTWNRNKCNYYMNKTMQKMINKDSLFQDNSDWNIYFPCAYDDINKEIYEMPVKKNARYFIIDNADQITAKQLLWSNIVRHHGLEKAKLMSPETFILSKPSDVKRMRNQHNPESIYILKRNVQRQEGLKITNDINEIIANNPKSKTGYILAQELQQNPYTIDGRKINMRVYVLVTCQNSNMDIYVYNNGFMYYTKEKFVKGSVEAGPNITTGYIDREVYEVNPLTHADFRKYLDKEDRKLETSAEKNMKKQGLSISNVTFNRIKKLIADIFVSFRGKICRPGKKLCQNITYQLFGADIALDRDLQPSIMEINKGPDLSPKDERDGTVKYNVMKDTHKILGAFHNEDNGFDKVLDIEGEKITYIS